VTLAEVELDRDRVGDLLAAGHCPGDQRPVETHESPVHLLGALEVELARIHPHPRGVVAEPASVDAQENVLGLGVFPIDVVAVAGGDRRNAELAGDLQSRLRHLPLHLQAVVLNLDEVAVAEGHAEPARDLPGLGQRGLLIPRRADQRPGKLA